MYQSRRNSGYRLKKRFRFVFVLFFFLTLLAGGGLWASGLMDDYLYEAGLIDFPEKPDAFKGRINVLVMGMDSRHGEAARADTIMLCSVDTEKNIMSILSIPRDTRVRIPGHGWEKINSATVYGGPGMAMKLVSDLLGIRVTSYVATDYDGFKSIIDTLGGVTVDIKERMYHHDPEDGGIYTIDLMPGVQRLDGYKALQYVRYRDYALGDIGRAEQQQQFLSALSKEVLQPSTVIRLPSLIAGAYRAVETNLSLLEMKKLAVAAGKMTGASLLTQTLPGQFLEYDGVSYWEPDPQLTRQVIAGIYEGRAVGKVVLGETKVISTEKPEEEPQKSQGGVVPGRQGQPGDATGTGVQGSAVKPGPPGTSGQQAAGAGAKTVTDKKQPGNVSGGSASGGSGQPPGGAIVPPRAPQKQDQQAEKKDLPKVIIVPKTVPN